MTAAVRVFVRHRSEVFCPRDRNGVGSSTDPLEVVTGDVRPDTTDPTGDARRALETTLPNGDFEFVRAGDPLSVPDGRTVRTIRPFLFEADGHDGGTERPFEEGEWLSPTAFRTRETAARLWESYRRVAPTVDLLRTDGTHGAAWLSVRALEVVRDTAGSVAFGAPDGGLERVVDVARALRDARPSMAVVRHRIDRVMDATPRTPGSIHDRALDAIEDAHDADRLAAERAAAAIANRSGRVATLSRSGTVAAAVRRAGRAVTVAESRPAREGVSTAERLARTRLDVSLTTDAALPGLVRDGDVSCVLLGADRILPNGDVVNKVGSYPLVSAAADGSVPAYVVAAADKVVATDEVIRESGDPSTVYDGDRPITVTNPIFERVPGDRLTGIVTEDGLLDGEAIAERARDHSAMSSWVDRFEADDGPE